MFRWIDRAVAWLEEVFITILLLTSSVILFANVVARYVFNTGFVGAEELVRYAIIWMVFVGGSVAVRKGIHIGIDVLLHVLPASGIRILRVVVGAISVIFCFVLLIYSSELVMQTRSFGQRSAAMQIPFWIIQMAIPVGAGLMMARFAQQLWRDATGRHQETQADLLG